MVRYCYVTLTHLLYDFSYNVESLQTLGTTLLVWDKWYCNLPGRCHVEESCETLLPRLVAPCVPIHNASTWTLHVICSSF